MPATLATVSYGGGVQSTAMLVLAAQGKLPAKTFLFANVGDDSEHPGTMAYVREIAKPYATFHGLELCEIQRQLKRAGRPETLFGRMNKPGSLALTIPVRGARTGAPGKRSCTVDFKIRVIGEELRHRGASEDHKAVVMVGISLDELHRINARKAQPYERLAYPLVGVLDGSFSSSVFDEIGAPLSRLDCEQIILAEPLPGGPGGTLGTRLRRIVETPSVCGNTEPHPAHGDCLGVLPQVTQDDLVASGYSKMPRPPKSACWFCPFRKLAEWQRMRRETPALFQASCELEAMLIERQVSRGRDPMYLTRFGRPLAEAVPDDPDGLWDFELAEDDASCDNGFCMT